MENTKYVVKVNITKYFILLIGGYLLMDGFYNKIYQSIRLMGNRKQTIYIPTTNDIFSLKNITLDYCVYETKRNIDGLNDYMLIHYVLLTVFDAIVIFLVSIEQKLILKWFAIFYTLFGLIGHIVTITIFIWIFTDYMNNFDHYSNKGVIIDHLFDIVFRLIFSSLVILNDYFLHKKQKIFKIIRVN